MRPESCCLSHSCRWCWSRHPRKPYSASHQPPLSLCRAGAPSFSHQVGFGCDAVSSSLHMCGVIRKAPCQVGTGDQDMCPCEMENRLSALPPGLLTRKGDTTTGGGPWGLPQLGTSWACLQAASGLRDNTGLSFQTWTLSEAGVHPGAAPLPTCSTGDDLTVTQPVTFLRSCLLDNSVQMNCIQLRPELLLP